jgi:hypothetical protein
MAGANGSNPFAWEDPFLLEAQRGEEERMIRDTARAYVQQRLWPRVSERLFGTRTRIGFDGPTPWPIHRAWFDFFENQHRVVDGQQPRTT